MGLSIGVCNGMNESIMSGMRSVPELYSFPPGVLPICVAYIGDERIYVVDNGNNRIQVFRCNTFVICPMENSFVHGVAMVVMMVTQPSNRCELVGMG